MNILENLKKRVVIDRGCMSEIQYAREEMRMSASTIKLIRNEKSVSLKTIQRYADHICIPGPVMFTDPRKDLNDDLCDYDLSFIPENVKRIRSKRGMNMDELASKTDMSGTRIESVECGVLLLNTVQLQAIADALEVDALTLMKPPDNCRYTDDEPITHKSYLPGNARVYINRIKLHDLQFNIEKIKVINIFKNKDNVRMDIIERIASTNGIGVADLFVKPGIKTEWYRESSVSYLYENVFDCIKETGMTIAYLASESGLDRTTIYGLKKDKSVYVSTIQKLSDALHIEFGDLLLPPKGE